MNKIKDYIKINREAYDRAAQWYQDAWDKGRDNLGKTVNRLQSFISNSDNILEIGCGTGQLLREFAQFGCATTGIDLSEKMCDIAKTYPPDSKIICQNILDCNFDDEEFDVIIMQNSIHCFPLSEANVLTRKVHNWLKPNGIFFCTTTIENDNEEVFFHKVGKGCNEIRFRKKFTESEFVKFITNGGFEILDSEKQTNPKISDKTWLGIISKKPGK